MACSYQCWWCPWLGMNPVRDLQICSIMNWRKNSRKRFRWDFLWLPLIGIRLILYSNSSQSRAILPLLQWVGAPQCQKTSLSHQGASSTWEVKARGAAKQSTMHRTDSITVQPKVLVVVRLRSLLEAMSTYWSF